MPQKDIENISDIEFLVNTFYESVQKNEVIGPVFNAAIGNNWPAHLDKMYRFWQTILLEEVAYSGSPFLAHAKLPIEKVHFDQWLSLWAATLAAHFKGPKADEAQWRAEKMGEMFQYKLAYYKDHPAKPIL